MNTTPRTATRGGNKKAEVGKGNKTDSKKDGSKNTDSKKANPASERIAKITETATDENTIKNKISLVMNFIGATEEDAITALFDCDNDVEKAVSLLIDGGGEQKAGQWETSGKKKKNKQAGGPKGEAGSGRGAVDGETDDVDQQPISLNQDRDRSRGRGGGASRARGRGAGEYRGSGRGRDNKENESGAGEDGPRGPRGDRGDRGDGFRRGGRGMSNGPGGRGGRGGRGGGGRLGSRTYPPRETDRRDRDAHRFPSTIDTWNPSGAQDKSEPMKMETWGDSFPAAEDWDNEEYTGSLADSKVFTPSAVDNAAAAAAAAAAAESVADSTSQDLLSMATASGQEYHQTSAITSSPLAVGVGTLNSAQAQYLTQLTQQSAENLKASAAAAAAAASAYGQAESLKSAVGIGSGSASGAYAQSANYGQSATVYGQPSYAPASYGAASTPYQGSSAYSVASAPGTNAFSSGTGAQASSYAAASSAPSNVYSATTTTPGNVYSSSSAPFQASIHNYQTATNSSFGSYSAGPTGYNSQSYTSSPGSFDNSNTVSDTSAPSAQPQRVKTQRPRVPPPSKIPSSAVEMPEDPGVNVASLDVQFVGLEFGSDSTGLDSVTGTESSSTVIDTNNSSSGLDAASTTQPSLNAYSNKGSANSQQASLVGGLTGKGLSSNDGLSIQSNEHKNSYNSSSSRAVSSTSGLDLSKSDVSNISYASAPTATNYSYQSQKSGSYQPTSYVSGSYTTTPSTYSNVAPAAAAAASSYSTSSYTNQQSVNSFPSSYGSQPSNANSYPVTGATYPSTNSFTNSSQNYPTSAGSMYGTYSTGYQNSYSGSSSATAKLNSGLTTTKESDFANNSVSNLTSSSISSSGVSGTAVSTTTASANVSGSGSTSSNASLLTSASAATPAVTTTSSKISTTGAMKSSVVPSLHPQMMGTPQYIMSGTGVPFYHPQTPVYGYEDVQLQLQRIPHHMTQYYDLGYTAPTSLPAGRDSLPNVAFTMADARYSRADNAASPVPSTLSQQTATGAHQQQMMNHPSFPPGYAYVYNTVPGSFQYASPIFPVPSAGNAHATSSSQFGKPASYGSTYGSGYEALNQTDYSKSPYVSSGVKSAVGVGASATSSSTTSDLYGKAHTALGKVNSYEKQAFHSATPPPFNLATGQGAGMAASGGYPPHLFIPAMAPQHQQHHNLIPSHLQESSSNSAGQRAQATAQANKSGNKGTFNPYWSSA